MIFGYIGRSIRPLKSCSAHKHENWELVYNHKGFGTMIVDGVEYPFEESSIMIYPPDTLHQKISQEHFEDYYVMFSGCELVPQLYCVVSNQRDDILQLLKIMYTCYHETGNNHVCNNLLDAIMGLVIPSTSGQIMDEQIQCVRRMLIDNFANADFTVGDVFSAIPQNEDYLRRRFKRILGMTPHAYLEALRVENAKKLLEHQRGSGMSIADIAYLSGFYDSLYFSRVFKKCVGLSPSEWKKKYQR